MSAPFPSESLYPGAALFPGEGNSPFGDRLAEKLEPWLTDHLEGVATSVIGPMFDPVGEVVEDRGAEGEAGFVPGYGSLLDVAQCPAASLGFLGQLVGVRVPTGASASEARAAIEAESGMARGTDSAIETAIRSVLGSAEFQVSDRTNAAGEEDAYHFLVMVGAGEASTALNTAVQAVKPGGVMFTVVEAADSWLAGTKAWDEVAETVTWSTAEEGSY